MENKTLYDILKSKSEKLTSQEIKNILDEELEKSPNEMDTDLVDLCLNALENEEKPQQSKKKIKISKILLIAAIFALVVAMAVPACAKYVSINLKDIGYTILDNGVRIDMTGNQRIFDILTDLEQDEISNPMLPSAFFEVDSTLYNYEVDNQEGIKTIEFDVDYKDYTGCCIISKYDEEYSSMLIGKFDIPDSFDTIEEIKVDGNSVLVYSNKKTACITYIQGNTDYTISLDCDHNTACEIAKTL